jgi:acetylglutamate kinase
MNKLQVIKIGGRVIEDESSMNKFIREIANLSDPCILVHGGGSMTTELALKLKIPQQLVEGRRVTDADTLKIAVMVYAGWINKQLVAGLQAMGTDAIGLSGADMNCISSTLRKKEGVDYGFAGDLNEKSVNGERFKSLLEIGFTPVVCSITHDGKGQLLNTNADTLASAIASEMSRFCEVQLNYCFEKQGVMRDMTDKGSVIPQLTKSEYSHLKNSGCIHSGMIPKLDNAFLALEKGVEKVIIAEAGAIENIIQNKPHHGTELSI